MCDSPYRGRLGENSLVDPWVLVRQLPQYMYVYTPIIKCQFQVYQPEEGSSYTTGVGGNVLVRVLGIYYIKTESRMYQT